jgi:anti-sigma factor RsiW
MTQPNSSTEQLSANHVESDRLNLFIDCELSPAEQQGIEQHLAGCHTCTLRVLSATQLKVATARAGNRFAPPPEALARLTARLHPQQHVKTPVRIDSFRRAGWGALAAAVLLALSLLGWRQLHQANTLTAELLDQHLATLSSGAAPQVISTDRHTVKPWFQGRLPFSFNLPDTTALPPDTTLKGADLTYIDGQPAALLLFTIHKHEVSIFLMQRATSPNLIALSNTRAGFTLHTATTPGLRIIAVSDVNPTELDLLLTSLVKAQSAQ